MFDFFVVLVSFAVWWYIGKSTPHKIENSTVNLRIYKMYSKDIDLICHLDPQSFYLHSTKLLIVTKKQKLLSYFLQDFSFWLIC